MTDARTMAKGELIGLRVRVAKHPDPTIAGCEGTVVDETKNTLSVAGNGTMRVVQKTGGTFEFLRDGKAVTLEGSTIAFRPEDRTKKAG
ncbi:MAG: ribonuclease P protein subunit [Methanobacteriota archaeon]